MSKTKYLDPKNDITFRKIFGEHPHLLISFLNSMLPLEPDRYIESITYKDGEIIPELPGFKRSIVDVHCTDNFGRIFIVEMQMYWTSSFMQRMLFNAGKAYVRQLKAGRHYKELNPVYGLSLVDDVFQTRPELGNVYYHHYQIVHTQVSNERIEGLELVFIELPKFKIQNYNQKRLQTLWLRFLTEINEETETIPQELLEEAPIREALDYLHKEAFTEEELKSYDEYWDAVRIEKAALEELKQQKEELTQQKEELTQQKEELTQQKEELTQQKEELTQKNEQLEKEKEEAKKREEEANQKIIELARILRTLNVPIEQITEKTGLSKDEIENLK